MKLSYFIGLVLLSLVKQNEASSKDQIVSILASVNSFVYNYASLANQELQGILQNETHWEETKVQQLVQQMTKLTDKVFSVINAFDLVFNSTVLTCAVKEEPALLQAIKNATEEFGFCSTKLEANLIESLKELTELSIGTNACFRAYINELNSCNDDDVVCLQVYVENARALINDLIKLGQFASILKKIETSYEELYHQVFNCAKTQFFPLVSDAIYRARINVQICSKDMRV